MKSILIINGHPNKASFNYALAESYIQGVSNKAIVNRINIADLKFNPNLEKQYQEEMVLEEDLIHSISKIKEADHIVWFFPVWWAGFPAIMKAFIDRVFLPNIMFKYQEGSPLPKKLLRGKTARIIVTSDTPQWYNYLYLKSPAVNQLRKGILLFCGVKPVKVTHIGSIRNSTKEKRSLFLKKIKKLGVNLK